MDKFGAQDAVDKNLGGAYTKPFRTKSQSWSGELINLSSTQIRMGSITNTSHTTQPADII